MIQLLRGTKSQLDSYQTVIAEGQPVFEKDTGQLKIGNGSSIYSALPYVGASSGSTYPNIVSQPSRLNSSYQEGYVEFSDNLRLCFGLALMYIDLNYFYWTTDGDLNTTAGFPRGWSNPSLRNIFGAFPRAITATAMSRSNNFKIQAIDVKALADDPYDRVGVALIVNQNVDADPGQQRLDINYYYSILCYNP